MAENLEEENLGPRVPSFMGSPEAGVGGVPEGREAEWEKVNAVFMKAQEAFLAGEELPAVIDSLIEVLQAIKLEGTGVGGLGAAGEVVPPPLEE